MVKTIFLQNFPQAVQSAQISSSAITALGEAVTVSLLGTPVAAWDGTGQNGTLVSNGKYILKVECTDAYAVVTTVAQNITVNLAFSYVALAVYNEAGEIVRHLYQGAVTTGSAMQSILLSSNFIQPDAPSGSGTPSFTLIQLSLTSGGVTKSWDGTNDQGSVVTNGQYFVEASWVNGKDGYGPTVTQKVAVIAGGAGLVPGNVVAQPNVLTGGQTTVTLKVASSLSLTLKARFYNLAGELVGVAQGSPGSNQLTWDTAGMASGLYIAVVDLYGPNGFVQRKTTRLVVQQ